MSHTIPEAPISRRKSSCQRHALVAVGELLWDVFPDDLRLGGAPLNVALHAGALGARSEVLSRIGRDALGDRVVTELAGRPVGTALLQRDSVAKTGTAAVTFSETGEPSFDLAADAAWDFLEAGEQAFRACASADAVYFGSLAQRSPRSRDAVRALIAASRPDALRIFDANLRAPHIDREVIGSSLDLATVLKVNDAELPILATMFDLPPGTLETQARRLADRFDLAVVACTLGGCGSFLLSGSVIDRHPGVPVAVVNTVGAGDSFTAALAMGLLFGMPLPEISATANTIAAHVCGHPGATPDLPASFCRRFLETPSDEPSLS